MPAKNVNELVTTLNEALRPRAIAVKKLEALIVTTVKAGHGSKSMELEAFSFDILEDLTSIIEDLEGMDLKTSKRKLRGSAK